MSAEAIKKVSDAMQYPYGDLAILSAEVFPGSPYKNNSRTNQAQKHTQTTGRTNKTDEAPRKRARTQAAESEEAEDEDKKRSRGRPRLDAKDESAADRRRTQIRLAQRAYRNRKENTITTLEKQVRELKDTNEEMSNAFMQLQDFALKNGILDQIPDFGRQLRETTQKFLSLAQNANEDGDDQQQGGPSDNSSIQSRDKSSTPDAANPTTQAPAKISNPQLLAGIVVTHEPVTDSDFMPDFSSSFTTPTTTTTTTTPPMLGYEIVAHPTIDNASFAFQPEPSPNFFDTQISSPYNALSAPKTYSSYEATFGRRLQRFATERAYVLITTTNPQPSRIERVFGFCLLFETTDSIRRRLGRMLTRNAQEGLHNWEFPFFHLGGAGTHYDATTRTTGHKMGNQGTRDVLKPANTAGYGMGPFNPEVNGARDSSLDENMRMEEPNFSGDFLDCDEVEIYLYQRGVVIPPGTDYVTADIDPDHFDNNQLMLVNVDPFSPPIQSSFSFFSSSFSQSNAIASVGRSPGESSGSALTPNDPSPPHQTTDAWPMSGSLVDPTLSGVYTQAGSYIADTIASSAHGDLLGGMFTAIAEGTNNPLTSGFEGFNSQTNQPQHQPSQLPKKQRIYFDVHRFIKSLVLTARCLGRTPGFRQTDVNNAFWKAAQVQGS